MSARNSLENKAIRRTERKDRKARFAKKQVINARMRYLAMAPPETYEEIEAQVAKITEEENQKYMENPETRPAAAKLIDSVIDEHFDSLGKMIFGLSLCMKIHNALVRAGYMIDFCNPPESHCPWDYSKKDLDEIELINSEYELEDLWFEGFLCPDCGQALGTCRPFEGMVCDKCDFEVETRNKKIESQQKIGIRRMRWNEETTTMHKCIHEALDLDWCNCPEEVRLDCCVKLPRPEELEELEE